MPYVECFGAFRAAQRAPPLCRLASAEHTAPEDAAAALAVALPVLVGKGLQSRVAAVKARTLNTLSAIVDVAAPPQIAPQLPALVAALLEALSTLEASAFGQLEMHAERLGVDAGALEAKRVALSSQTPMHSALDRCARLVSADSVDAVVAVLTNLIRRGARARSPPPRIAPFAAALAL